MTRGWNERFWKNTLYHLKTRHLRDLRDHREAMGDEEQKNKPATSPFERIPGGHKPLLRCIVKLGGAAITCKNELESINEEILESVCVQLREAMSKSANSSSGNVVSMDWSKRLGKPLISAPEEFRNCRSLDLDSNFIVVHGAGSFGHFQASSSGVHKGGLHLPLVKAGFVATRISVTSLNLEIVRALAREGIPSVGMPPFACGWSTHGRNVASADVSHVVSTLHSGFVPVLHGDAVVDDLQTDVLGVYDRPPTDPHAILLRKIDEDGNWMIVKPKLQHEKMGVEITVAAHDTTGGMKTKISEAAMIAKLGIDVYITKLMMLQMIGLGLSSAPPRTESFRTLMAKDDTCNLDYYQPLSVCIGSSLAASANGGSCGAVTIVNSDVRLLCKIPMNSVIIGPSLRRQELLRLHPTSSSRTRRMSSRVRATWPFRSNGKEMDVNIERSEAANEDILIFFFQLDLETRIQYALNMEQYEAAQQLRNKLDEVEAEIIKQREAKRGSRKSEAQDKAINLLRLRADMQKAIEDENYAVAAELRDEISKLEAEILAASAKALAYENIQYAFRLGQRVRHKKFGYRAVICGMDPVCCESSSWMQIAHVDKLLQGRNQPFYQVLVDVRADPNLLVAYVAEENLLANEQPDMDRFDHPYASFLFYGMDTAGDFIPIKQLREKYNKPRHEVPVDTSDGDAVGMRGARATTTGLSTAHLSSARSYYRHANTAQATTRRHVAMACFCVHNKP
ncbi:Amino acid kinase family [Musa troglodytarum]|uniref:Isopentenyl phosphate kinase n=1 Tax=Musa troglodytarum TaxID=320322 RepID=A0A9E7F1Q5_9LILI|nr:Amino acid kinase family [Musa troglodytarum]